MRNGPRRIVCLGDSLTLAIGEAELDKWPVRMANRLEAEFPGEFSVYIRAWNGATTKDALERMPDEAGYLLPAMVFVALGVNDSLVRPHRRTAQVGVEEFVSNLREIHRLITEAGGSAIFVATHFPDDRPDMPQGNGRTHAANFRPYHRALLDLSTDLEVPLIDIPATLKSRGLSTSELVVSDGLHLSAEGNAVYSEILGEAAISLSQKTYEQKSDTPIVF